MKGDRRVLFADHTANILALQFASAECAAHFSIDVLIIRAATLALKGTYFPCELTFFCFFLSQAVSIQNWLLSLTDNW